MPAADDDIETRSAIVERDVAELREQLALTSSDAAAARTLAAGADHDVSEVRAELRAHTQALNALRETQLEQGRKIDEHGRKFDEHVSADFHAVGSGQGPTRGRGCREPGGTSAVLRTPVSSQG